MVSCVHYTSRYTGTRLSLSFSLRAVAAADDLERRHTHHIQPAGRVFRGGEREPTRRRRPVHQCRRTCALRDACLFFPRGPPSCFSFFFSLLSLLSVSAPGGGWFVGRSLRPRARNAVQTVSGGFPTPTCVVEQPRAAYRRQPRRRRLRGRLRARGQRKTIIISYDCITIFPLRILYNRLFCFFFLLFCSPGFSLRRRVLNSACDRY